MKKRILSVLLCGSLLFGTVFANAVSVEFTEENNSIETYSDSKATNEIIVTENIPHIHTGNSASGGGCYTVPIYHKHIGDGSTQEGCYVNSAVHNHNSCPYTITREYVYNGEFSDDVWSIDSNGTAWCWYTCPKYGERYTGQGYYGGSHWHDIKVYTCGKPYYELSCGMTTETVVGWELSCHISTIGTVYISKEIKENYKLAISIDNINENASIISCIWNNGDIFIEFHYRQSVTMAGCYYFAR